GEELPLLQWSRRANATETRATSGRPRRSTRSFNGAVARTRRRPRSPAKRPPLGQGFNGAVARTRRRPAVVLDGLTEAQALQWSRRANATETCPRHVARLNAQRASMEPSRERDGDARVASSPSAAEKVLQW